MAKSFIVTTLADGGVGSLRNAIAQANGTQGSAVIKFAKNLKGTIKLTGGVLNITDNVAIVGPGANNVTIDGNLNSGIFIVDNGNQDKIRVRIQGITLTQAGSISSCITNVENLTIANINITNNPAEAIASSQGFLRISNSNIYNNGGGGINNTGSLSINKSTITGNGETGILTSGNTTVNNTKILDNNGTGISSTSRLNVNNSEISNNTYLGIINNSSISNSANIKNTTISNNQRDGVELSSGGSISQSNLSGNGGRGLTMRDFQGNKVKIIETNIDKNLQGGVKKSGGELTIDKSSIYQNSSTGITCSGTLTINNSTISGNTTPGIGGGIYLFNPIMGLYDKKIKITNTTITQNSAPAGKGSGLAFSGFKDKFLIEIGNTIIAGNVNSDADVITSTTLQPSSFSKGNNLIGFGSAVVQNQFNAKGDQREISDPKLGPLTDNGGLTPTHALLDTSLAINKGNNSLSKKFKSDQRGFKRVFDKRVDIGAYELQPSAKKQSVDLLTGNPQETILVGTLEADVFKLGNKDFLSYARSGMLDYALIKDFDPHEDLLKLHGKESDYLFATTSQGIEIFNQTKQPELIAVIEGIFNLSTSNYYFVS